LRRAAIGGRDRYKTFDARLQPNSAHHHRRALLRNADQGQREPVQRVRWIDHLDSRTGLPGVADHGNARSDQQWGPPASDQAIRMCNRGGTEHLIGCIQVEAIDPRVQLEKDTLDGTHGKTRRRHRARGELANERVRGKRLNCRSSGARGVSAEANPARAGILSQVQMQVDCPAQSRWNEKPASGTVSQLRYQFISAQGRRHEDGRRPEGGGGKQRAHSLGLWSHNDRNGLTRREAAERFAPRLRHRLVDVSPGPPPKPANVLVVLNYKTRLGWLPGGKCA